MKKYTGITLIELLISLAVLSILLSIATSSLGQFVSRHHSDIVMSELAKLIYVARHHAITANTYTTLCPSEDRVSCVNNWNRPLILFTDKNKNETVDGNDKVLRISSPDSEHPGHLTLRVSGNKFLQFNARGFSNGKFGNLTFCPQNQNPTLARRIVINRMGRIRHEKDKNGDGVIDTSTPLLCNS